MACGREASEWGQAVGNALALSMACPHAPKGAGWSEGLVHMSPGLFNQHYQNKHQQAVYNSMIDANACNYKI